MIRYTSAFSDEYKVFEAIDKKSKSFEQIVKLVSDTNEDGLISDVIKYALTGEDTWEMGIQLYKHFYTHIAALIMFKSLVRHEIHSHILDNLIEFALSKQVFSLTSLIKIMVSYLQTDIEFEILKKLKIFKDLEVVFWQEFFEELFASRDLENIDFTQLEEFKVLEAFNSAANKPKYIKFIYPDIANTFLF